MHSHTSHQQQPDMSREIHEIPYLGRDGFLLNLSTKGAEVL